MVKILLKRTDDSSKVVNPETLDYGELALNYSEENGALYYKNSNDEIEKFKNSVDTSAEIDAKVSRLMTDTELKFFCVEPVTVTITTKNGEIDEREFSANTLVDMFLNSEDTFTVTPATTKSITMLMAWPGALGTFYDWLEGVDVFDGILFDMNNIEMYIKWSQQTQGQYHVQQAQYTNCIFWSDLPFILSPMSERNNYTLNRSSNMPLCYSSIPENTFKPFYCCYNVVCDPNLSSPNWLEGLANATGTTSPWSYYGIMNIGSTDDMPHNVITLPADCMGLMYYAQSITTAGIFDAANVTNFGSTHNGWGQAFGECIHLETLLIRNLKVDINLSWSPISQQSLTFILDKAANENGITISLSPHTFYRLTTDNTELAATKNITLKLVGSNYADDKRFDDTFVFTITGTPIADSTEEFPHNCTFTADKTYDEFLSAYNEKKRIVINTVIVLSAEESGVGDVTEFYSEVDDFYLFKVGEELVFAFKYSVIIPIFGGGLTEYIIMLGKQNGELVIDFLGDYYTNSQDLSKLSNYAEKLSKLDEIKYNLAELDDVGIETPTEGQKLVYDSNSQKWINVDDNMPTPTTADSGKFLRVDANGKYVLETIQSAEELTY